MTLQCEKNKTCYISACQFRVMPKYLLYQCVPTASTHPNFSLFLLDTSIYFFTNTYVNNETSDKSHETDVEKILKFFLRFLKINSFSSKSNPKFKKFVIPTCNNAIVSYYYPYIPTSKFHFICI